MKAQGVVKGLAGAVALLLMYPLAAYADNVTPDGDISVKGVDVSLQGCVLPSAEVKGHVAVKRTANDKSHFLPGEVLSASYSTSSASIKVDAPATVTVPDGYTANGKRTEFYVAITTQVVGDAAVGNGSVTITLANSTYSESGSYNVNWDCSGPADTTAPTLILPADIVAEATSAAGANVPFTVSAQGDENEIVTVECFVGEQYVESGALFPLGTTTVDCIARDEAGNADTGSFTVTVQDTTAPEIQELSDIAAEATSVDGAFVEYGPFRAHDIVDGEVTVTCAPASGSVFPLGKTIVDCTAKDAAGNTSTASFAVTVVVGWGGFLQPLYPGGPKTFKLNSTIPVKFQLAGASAGITDLDARLYVRPVGSGDEFAATSTSGATTGNAFRWDADGGHYIFNLSTKAIGKAGTYELRVDLGDGVPHTIQVEIRK